MENKYNSYEKTTCGCTSHCHEHEHEEENKVFNIARFIAATVLLVVCRLCRLNPVLSISLYIVAFLVVGYDILADVVKNLVTFNFKSLLDEKFLMTVACGGAFALGEYPEAVIIMLFYQIGEFFTDCAAEKSKKSVEKLMDIRPDYANLLTENGVKTVSPQRIAVGDTIVVKPGEKIPLDGIVVYGNSYADISALTGESTPAELFEGCKAISGSINKTGLIHIKVSSPFAQSTVSKILELMENDNSKKSKSERFITKFARVYTPCVVAGALVLAFGVPFVTGSFAFGKWIHRALILLVVSCPCALVLSIPLSFFGGIGCASANGILIKGSESIEKLANIRNVAFDKTGTLSCGKFSVSGVKPAGNTAADELFYIAALSASGSSHPVSQAVKRCYEKSFETKLDEAQLKSFSEKAGFGINAQILYKNKLMTVCAGNVKLIEEKGFLPVEASGTCMHVVCDSSYIGCIELKDELKKSAKPTVEKLKKLGINCVMLTGDNKSAAQYAATELDIEYSCELLPAQKVEHIKSLSHSGTTAFVGDGVNDAPVITAADLGIAMGAIGSDAAIDAADVVIMDDDIKRIPGAVKIAKRTLLIAKENIVFCIAVKAIVLLLGAVGVAGILPAVFADVGVSLIAVLNSLRALSFRKL